MATCELLDWFYLTSEVLHETCGEKTSNCSQQNFLSAGNEVTLPYKEGVRLFDVVCIGVYMHFR